MPVIAVDQVSKKLRGQHIFEAASARFERGKITAVTGPNGSGKSVLFRMICGFVKPDAGRIVIDPEFLSPSATYPEDFGILIDGPGYLPFARGFENLERLASIRGVAGRAEIEHAMREVGLDPATRQRVRNYSLGMKQKLGLAQAFMEGQRVLLLDEPFNGLDRDSTSRVRELLRRMRDDEGRTIVFTSHIREDVEVLADAVYEINSRQLELVVG